MTKNNHNSSAQVYCISCSINKLFRRLSDDNFTAIRVSNVIQTSRLSEAVKACQWYE